MSGIVHISHPEDDPRDPYVRGHRYAEGDTIVGWFRGGEDFRERECVVRFETIHGCGAYVESYTGPLRIDWELQRWRRATDAEVDRYDAEREESERKPDMWDE